MLVIPLLGCLIIFTYIGVKESKNVKDLQDFAFSKGSFNTFTLVTTIVATFIGGGMIIGLSEKSYQMGVIPMFGLVAFPLQLILTAFFITPRVYQQDNCVSLGSMLQKKYGPVSKIILGICWTIFCIGILSVQMLALGRILSLFVPIAPWLNNLIASSFVIAYCLTGGIRAVILTDRLQFLLMITVVPLFLFFLIKHLLKSDLPIHSLFESQKALFFSSKPWQIVSIFFTFLLGDALIPPVIQRVQVAKHYFQAKKAFIMGALLCLLLCVVSSLLGILLHALRPGLQGEQLVPVLFDQFLPKALQVAGVLSFLAVILSTTDSYLNSMAYTFISDVLVPLKTKPISEKGKLYSARLVTFIFGSLAFLVSITGQKAFDLLIQSYKFWGPIMMVPVLYLLFHKAIETLQLYLVWTLSFIVVLLWDVFRLEDVTTFNSLVAGILVNFLLFNAFLAFNTFKEQSRVKHYRVS